MIQLCFEYLSVSCIDCMLLSCHVHISRTHVNLCIQSEHRKIRTRKISVFGNFAHSDVFFNDEKNEFEECSKYLHLIFIITLTLMTRFSKSNPKLAHLKNNVFWTIRLYSNARSPCLHCLSFLILRFLIFEEIVGKSTFMENT